MPAAKPLLLIPVENQVRELDPKLLLACTAAERGFSSVLGSRRDMEMRIDEFPGSLYLSKSMTVRSLLFFIVARRFDVDIITWDEEALVHLPEEVYFSRRLDPRAIRYVRGLFAWGEDNAQLWRRYPHLPPEAPIFVTGNPRCDLLRPELHAYYAEEVEAIRREHGDFILVNTNFNHVNAFGPDMNLFRPPARPGGKPRFGRAARGMSRAYAEGLRDHKLAVFRDFQAMLPRLAESFPEFRIVVRPHPTENHEPYRRIASRCPALRVTNEGNVVPWLLAARALVHNGCTTGVEAFAMGIPAVSYRASVNPTYDDGFYHLPNRLSYSCFSFEELRTTLARILEGRLGAPDGEERRALLQRFMAAQEGPLACERIVGLLESGSWRARPAAGPSWRRRTEQWLVARGLAALRRVKGRLPGSHNRPEFQRHRFPGIRPEELGRRLERFQRMLGFTAPLAIEPLGETIHRIRVVEGEMRRP